MHARIDSLTKQISQLLASGVSSLYARLDELGIEASTPSLLLESAKDIVARHKKITVCFLRFCVFSVHTMPLKR